MKLLHTALTLLLGAGAMACAEQATVAYQPDITTTKSRAGTDIFQPDSLSIVENYRIPDWFSDGKFGIFIHWGVYSVPAYGSEWYPRNMYNPKSAVHKYHVKTYGEVDTFGYKDFIPMFKAPEFDAKEWAALFKKSGATYVVPVAEHHDGFAMYNSSVNPWNSVKMGPEIDVIGELKEAVTAEGMHFGLSSHRCENAWFYSYGLLAPSDVQDRSISLYGERLEPAEGKGMTPFYGNHEGSNEKSREEFLKHTYELIDKYQPELMWFDWSVGKFPFQPTFYRFMAYYYNTARDWGKEVVVNTKFGFGSHTQVFDIERGKSDKIRRMPWQTDTSIGKKSWSYCPNEENKSPNHVIDDFVDIVSKNGNLLLNVGPRREGTITEEQEAVLLAMGEWLQVNGESIYKTRPWVVAGEGDTKAITGYMTDGKMASYQSNDFRFTTRDGYLYATSLAWGEGEVLLRSLNSDRVKNLEVTSVSLVGSNQPIAWRVADEGLYITYPTTPAPTSYAHPFKIKYSGVAIGKLQMEQDIARSNYVLLDGFISNQTDAPYTATVEIEVAGELHTEEMTIAPHEMGYYAFEKENLPDGKHAASLRVNGEEINQVAIKAPFGSAINRPVAKKK